MSDISELAKDVIEKAEKATPRPWETAGYDGLYKEHTWRIHNNTYNLAQDARHEDAAYIVAACNAAPELARAVIYGKEAFADMQMEKDMELAAKDAEIAQLRQALEAVEWVTPWATIDLPKELDECPWCHNTREEDHTAVCERQKALGLA